MEEVKVSDKSYVNVDFLNPCSSFDLHEIPLHFPAYTSDRESLLNLIRSDVRHN